MQGDELNEWHRATQQEIKNPGPHAGVLTPGFMAVTTHATSLPFHVASLFPGYIVAASTFRISFPFWPLGRQPQGFPYLFAVAGLLLPWKGLYFLASNPLPYPLPLLHDLTGFPVGLEFWTGWIDNWSQFLHLIQRKPGGMHSTQWRTHWIITSEVIPRICDETVEKVSFIINNVSWERISSLILNNTQETVDVWP